MHALLVCLYKHKCQGPTTSLTCLLSSHADVDLIAKIVEPKKDRGRKEAICYLDFGLVGSVWLDRGLSLSEVGGPKGLESDGLDLYKTRESGAQRESIDMEI